MRCLASLLYCENDEIVKWVISNDFFKVAEKHILNRNNNIVRTVCFGLSNIAACYSNEIRLKLLANEMLMGYVVTSAITKSHSIKHECIWTIANLSYLAGAETARILV